jgi:hypothetical protein
MMRTRTALVLMIPAWGLTAGSLTACLGDVPIGHGVPETGDSGASSHGDSAASSDAKSGKDAGGGDGSGPACEGSSEGTLLTTSPTGTTAAFPQPGFMAIALDEASVYWIYMPWSSDGESQGPGAVMKVAKGGGAAVTLATDKAPSFDFVVAGGHVYWESDGYLYWEPTSGGSPATLSYDVIGNAPLVADDTNLYSFSYWPGVETESILSEPLGSGNVTNLMNPGPLGQAEIMNLAIDTENAYWVGWLGSGSPYGIPPVAQQGLYYVPKAGGTAQLLASYEIQDPSTTGGLTTQPHVVADATGVYWNCPTGLMRMPSVDMAPITLVPGVGPLFGDSVNGLGVDGTSLYWLGGEGVQKVPIGGGPTATVVHESASIFAVDDAFVYWINTCGQVKKIAK